MSLLDKFKACDVEESQKALTKDELVNILNSTDYSVAIEADQGNVISNDDLKKLLDRSNVERSDRVHKTKTGAYEVLQPIKDFVL